MTYRFQLLCFLSDLPSGRLSISTHILTISSLAPTVVNTHEYHPRTCKIKISLDTVYFESWPILNPMFKLRSLPGTRRPLGLWEPLFFAYKISLLRSKRVYSSGQELQFVEFYLISVFFEHVLMFPL